MLACQVAQSWPALCNPGSSVHGVLQARILEWVEAFGRGRVRRREEVQCSSFPTARLNK